MTVCRKLGNCFKDEMHDILDQKVGDDRDGDVNVNGSIVVWKSGDGEEICMADEKPEAESVASDGPSVSYIELTPIPAQAKRRRSLKVYGEVVVDPEHCVAALVRYIDCAYKWLRLVEADRKVLQLQAIKHLSAEGWKFRYVREQDKQELEYTSPSGWVFSSLLCACIFERARLIRQESKWSSHSKKGLFVKTITKKGSALKIVAQKKQNKNCGYAGELEDVKHIRNGHSEKDMFAPLKQKPHNNLSWLIDNDVIAPEEGVRYILGEEVLATGKVTRKGVRCDCCDNVFGLTNFEEHAGSYYRRPMANIFLSDGKSLMDCKLEFLKGAPWEGYGSSALIESCPPKVKPYKHGRRFKKGPLARSEPPVTASNPAQPNAHTILSWLIDNDVILPREKVTCINKADGSILATGKVMREGIKCACCNKVFSLTEFKIHSRCNDEQQSENIFLSDGRSLLECQLKALRLNESKGLVPHTIKRVKRNKAQPLNEDICSICHKKENLITCCYCLSLFHVACVGLEDYPQGRWFCLLCRCATCRRVEANNNSEAYSRCYQCERIYHNGCVSVKEETREEQKPQDGWFCSKPCSKVFDSLQKILGKSYSTRVREVTWSILRTKMDDEEDMVEHHSKLWVAVNMLHECFVPIIEPLTMRDLVADVLFNRRSEYQHLNFSGFYTMLLQKGDEFVSVATVRIYGDKVAELPLIATSVQYRFQGMCRLLVEELEKMLAGLGVERLIVHAVPQMLQSWTNSFGFSVVDKTERLNLLDYRFLDFKDTVMCQKFLKNPNYLTLTDHEGF